jgi:hypothetical protein
VWRGSNPWSVEPANATNDDDGGSIQTCAAIPILRKQATESAHSIFADRVREYQSGMDVHKPRKDTVPQWERGNAARTFVEPAHIRVGLPTISQDGSVKKAFLHPRLGAPPRKRTHAALKQEEADEAGHKTADKRGSKSERDLVRGADARDRGSTKRKYGATQRAAEAFGAELERFERAKAQIAGLASMVVADPETHVARLNELRKMAKAPNRSIATLIILTESQLYKDICPSYRIRAVSDEEAGTKVSKDVARLRNFEQALLTSYTRFVESAISHSRWTSGCSKPPAARSKSARRTDTDARSEPERKMQKLRRAACTALIEVARSLLHFNLAEVVAPVVAGFATDRDADVRTEAANALTEILGETHRCAGPSLANRVLIAESLSKAAVSRKVSAPREALAPFLAINFPFFSRVSSWKSAKKDIKKPFNRKHRTKGSSAKADKAAMEAAEEERRDRLDLERDLQEAQAEASPQELFGAKKRLLNAVCLAYFNVIKAASEAAEADESTLSARRSMKHTRGLGDGNEAFHSPSDADSPHITRVRRPPPALAEALEGTLRVASMLTGELLDAILAALAPLLEGERLPLGTRFRCLAAAYSILSTHAVAQDADADSFTRDARAMDFCLYTALGRLYGPSMPLNSDETVTAEALRAVGAAFAGRHMPRIRAAAIARRLGILASAKAPTHGCAIGLVAAMQTILEKNFAACLFPVKKNSSSSEKNEFGLDGGNLCSYDQALDDPDICGAEYSAAWELTALAVHFHPSVRSISTACGRGVCGDRMPSGQGDASALVSAHTSLSGGFNPAPNAIYVARRDTRSAATTWTSSLLKRYDTVLRGDLAFPYDAPGLLSWTVSD